MTIVAVGPQCWGSGKDKATAVRLCFKQCPYRSYKKQSDMPFNLYDASEDWEVFDDGTIKAKTLTKLEEYRPAKTEA